MRCVQERLALSSRDDRLLVIALFSVGGGVFIVGRLRKRSA
jgi:hypothetical protein